MPDLWEAIFPNGLKIIGMKNDEIPTVNISITIEMGHRMDELAKSGLSYLTADLLNESTQIHTTEQISNMLSMLGSTVEVHSGEEEINMSIYSLAKNVDATLKIAEEMLLQPKFDQGDFLRLKEEHLQTINNQITQPVVIANNSYKKIVYGKEHILYKK